MNVKEHTDNWQLIREGDKIEFEKAFKLYYKPLCDYARTIIRDNDESEEIVQNVFYIIWCKRDTLEITTSLKAYLYRAVYNSSLNKLKHIKIKLAHAEDYKSNFSPAGANNIVERIDGKELDNKIHSALNSLPEQCGTVFKLSRFENLKYSEIAEKLGISVKTVENHMGKALKIMRENLKDYLPLLIWLLH